MFDFSNITKTTAVLEIIILMLVAAIIGFAIAWFYWRQKYRKLEAEFADYRSRSEEKETKLRGELQALGVQLDKCREDLEVNKKKLLALQMVQIKLDTLETKHKSLEGEHAVLQENYNALLTKNAGLGAQVQTLEVENKDQVTQLLGLNKEVGKLKGELEAFGLEYGILETALRLCRAQDKKGKSKSKNLVATPVAAETVAVVDGKKKKKKAPAKKKKSKTEVLKEVASKRETIDYGLIGTALEAEKEDLKVIKGIGPFIEQKLHALGIYTYRQIAAFDDNIIEKVTAALEAFPGRIKRDDWMGQARDLAK